jgi:hypothetical protein
MIDYEPLISLSVNVSYLGIFNNNTEISIKILHLQQKITFYNCQNVFKQVLYKFYFIFNNNNSY